MYCPVEVPRLGQIPGSTQQHGRVAVMAAGMHYALARRVVGELVGFFDRQGIHVRSQPDRRPIAGLQYADDPRLADVAMNRAAELSELLRHEIRGAMLLEAELGMCMQILAPCCQISVKSLDAIDDVHDAGSPAEEMRLEVKDIRFAAQARQAERASTAGGGPRRI